MSKAEQQEQSEGPAHFRALKEEQGFDPVPVMYRDLSWQALTKGALKAKAGGGRREAPQT